MSQRTRFSATGSTGEAAVEGLLRGMAAGIAMLGFLLVAGLILGEPERQAILAAGAELAASRWISQISALPAWMAGMAYGIVLFVLAESLAQALPLPMQQMDSGVMLAAHTCYGFVLGTLSQ